MEGLQMKYFVLKPKGNDRYAQAARKAMRAYALHIQNENIDLANQMRDWVKKEDENADVSESLPSEELQAHEHATNLYQDHDYGDAKYDGYMDCFREMAKRK